MQTFIFVNITKKKKKKKDLGKYLYRLRNVIRIILSGYLIYIFILCAYFFAASNLSGRSFHKRKALIFQGIFY